MSELVVALDQGSSSTRALAVDREGRVFRRAQVLVATRRPRAGWFEHDAGDLAEGAEKALDEVVAACRHAEIAGLGVAAQRSTVVFWDKRGGKPLCPAISWQDGRAAEATRALSKDSARVHRVTGLYLTPYYSAPKIRWVLERVAAVRRARDAGTLLVGPVSTYLIWRLTKGELFVADPSMAQRMLLLDLKTLDWSEPMLALFGIPREILPRLRPSAAELGSCRVAGRTLKIMACVGDQQAAALGLGAAEAGASVVNHGTGAFFLHNTGTEPRRIAGLLTSIGWQVGGSRPRYLSEGTVHAAGTSFDWLREGLGLLKKGESVDALCRASRERVLALPAIGGLGAPRWDDATKTAFFGLTSHTVAADLVRAVTEGVAHLVADIVAAMRAGGLRPKLALAAGGLSRIDHLLQFEADMTRLEIARAQEAEATALGAASLAVEAAGDARWAARLRRPRISRRFHPRAGAGEASAKRRAWRAFVDAQAALSRSLSLS